MTRFYLCMAALAGTLSACSAASGPAAPDAASAQAAPPQGAGAAGRIVGVGGALTECLFALGVGEQVVGVDTSSLWPPEVEALPKVGYQRAVAVEGVLSLKPTAVFAVHEAGPPAALEQLKQAGVRLVQFADVTTPEAAEARLRQLGEALGRKERAEELALQMRQSLASTAKRIESRAARPRALLIYARGAGQAFVAGKGTSAETALRLAGASPAVDNLEGFRPLTSEAVLLAAPEVVVVPKRALQSLGGEEGLWALPGLAQTPAGASKRLVLVDDSALLGFGPRMPDAVAALAQALHPEEP